MRTLIVLTLCLAAGPVLAQRPATYAMSCQRTQALVATRGQAVLQTSPTTYDRFVADERFCQRDEFAEPMWVPATDTPACPLYHCQARSGRLWDR